MCLAHGHSNRTIASRIGINSGSKCVSGTKVSGKSAMAGPFNSGDTIINKHLTVLYYVQSDSHKGHAIGNTNTELAYIHSYESFLRKPTLWTLRNVSIQISLGMLILADTFRLRGIDV